MTTFFFRSGSRLAAAVTVLVALCLAITGVASAENRIAGGEPVGSPGFPAIPSFASLVEADNGDDGSDAQVDCGGTLVSPTLVLTAGHCVFDGATVKQPSTVRVGFGKLAWRDYKFDDSTTLAVAQVIPYPGYQDVTGKDTYDVALLRLAAPVTNIAPMPIVRLDQADLWSENSQGTSLGFGYTDDGDDGDEDEEEPDEEPDETDVLLRTDELSINSDAECTTAFGTEGFTSTAMFCAGNGISDICSGDSGGPFLVTDARDAFVLAGVVSWKVGEDCPSAIPGSVFARVGSNPINGWLRQYVPLPPPSSIVFQSPVNTSNVTPRDTLKPILGAVSLTNSTFVVDSKGTPEKPVASAKKGTTFRYRLSEASRVVFKIEKVTKGRKSGKKCVKQTKRNRKKAKCTRYGKVGAFAQAGKAGANSKKFSGRIGKKKLAPGSYRATLVATDAAGNKSKVSSLKMKVVRR